MRSFIEIVPATTGYKFIRNMDSYNAVGVKADDIPGWYDAQQYRCFRSSNNAVVAHETLLVTQPKYNTHITVDSVLTYTQYAKYYEKFQGNADYEQFAQFYKQPISTTVTVIGTEGIEDPNLQPLTEPEPKSSRHMWIPTSAKSSMAVQKLSLYSVATFSVISN